MVYRAQGKAFGSGARWRSRSSRGDPLLAESEERLVLPFGAWNGREDVLNGRLQALEEHPLWTRTLPRREVHEQSPLSLQTSLDGVQGEFVGHDDGRLTFYRRSIDLATFARGDPKELLQGKPEGSRRNPIKRRSIRKVWVALSICPRRTRQGLQSSQATRSSDRSMLTTPQKSQIPSGVRECFRA